MLLAVHAPPETHRPKTPQYVVCPPAVVDKKLTTFHAGGEMDAKRRRTMPDC
jgi:hypothetical protein